jgi:hypothetical protein
MILWQAYLSFTLLLFLLLSPLVSSVPFRSLLLTCCLLIGFVPLDGLALAAYVRSFTDDLAMTTLIGLAWLTLERLGHLRPVAPRQARGMLMIMLVFALILYPATLGLSYFDPYRWGFNPQPMIVVVGLGTLGLFWLRQYLTVVMLVGATLAFALRIKPSENYWDYLVDPLLALFCCVVLLVSATRHVLQRRRQANAVSLIREKSAGQLA